MKPHKLSMTSCSTGFVIWNDEARRWIIDASVILSDGLILFNPKLFKPTGDRGDGWIEYKYTPLKKKVKR